jgi:hypothetical protein
MRSQANFECHEFEIVLEQVVSAPVTGSLLLNRSAIGLRATGLMQKEK